MQYLPLHKYDDTAKVYIGTLVLSFITIIIIYILVQDSFHHQFAMVSNSLLDANLKAAMSSFYSVYYFYNKCSIMLCMLVWTKKIGR